MPFFSVLVYKVDKNCSSAPFSFYSVIDELQIDEFLLQLFSLACNPIFGHIHNELMMYSQFSFAVFSCIVHLMQTFPLQRERERSQLE